MRTFAVLLVALSVTAVALASPPQARVAVRSTSLGSVLVDSRGHTLYVYDLDHGRSACVGACAAAWPPLLTSAKPIAVAGVPAAKLGTIKRAGGKLQVTFMGHPLYFFAKDAKAGQVSGAAIAHWAALTAAGAKLHKASSDTSGYTAPPISGGGSDYGGYGP